MNKKQKFFGDKGIIAMLALLSAFPPLSTDLYLPALPHMVEVLDTSQGLVNLSLSLFLVFFALGILIWGPVSEKYGRKPVLLAGLGLYILGSMGCALSSNVTWLIISRVVQAFGGGAAEAVATAMVKDMFSDKKREAVLAMVMAMVVVAPVVAPILGAMILKFMSWDTIFWVLTGIGVICFLLSLLLDETLENKYTGSLACSLGRLGVVLKNPGFCVPLAIFSLAVFPLMAFIAASAFVYIDGFNMTESMYSYFFAFNALGAMAGPLMYMRLSKYMASGSIITGCFGLILVCGIAMEATGSSSPFIFALIMATATIAQSLMRAPSANLLLSQQQTDTGSAAALINFGALLSGSIGMFLISFETAHLISTLGLMLIAVGAGCGSLWILVRGQSFIRQTAGQGE